ncbi:MAG: hypothetical protein ABH815_03810 [Candidatus Omnitrophota bacterium]
MLYQIKVKLWPIHAFTQTEPRLPIPMNIIHTDSKRMKDKSLEECFARSMEELSNNPEADTDIVINLIV